MPMTAILSSTFSNFVDRLVYAADSKTLLAVLDPTGAHELQPTSTYSRHRSSILYLNKSEMVHLVHINDLKVLMLLVVKLTTDTRDREAHKRGDNDPPTTIAIWGLMSQHGFDPKIHLVLSRLCKASKIFEVIVGEPDDANAGDSPDNQHTLDVLSHWCDLVPSTDV